VKLRKDEKKKKRTDDLLSDTKDYIGVKKVVSGADC